MATKTRLRQIISFVRLGSSVADLLKLGVLGIARGHPFSSNDVISRVGRSLWSTLTLEPRKLQGARVILDPSDLGHLISFEEVVLEGCYDLGAVPFEPDLICDCGAHIGLFSLLAGRRFPLANLVAFEPHPQNLEFLHRQAELNGLAISIIDAAVALEDGQSWFDAADSNTGSLASAASRLRKSFQVRTIDLPKWLSEQAPSSLLLKVDIEGEEARVLPQIAASIPQRTAMFFETHNGEGGWRAIKGFLEGEGFACKRIRTRGAYTDGMAIRSK